MNKNTSLSTGGKKRKFDAKEADLPPSKKPEQDVLNDHLSDEKKLSPREQLAAKAARATDVSGDEVLPSNDLDTETPDPEERAERDANLRRVAHGMVIDTLEVCVEKDSRELRTAQLALLIAKQEGHAHAIAGLYGCILELVKKIEDTKKDIKLMKKTIEDPKLLTGCVACGMSHVMKDMFIHEHAYVCTVYCAEQLGDSDTCECISCLAKKE